MHAILARKPQMLPQHYGLKIQIEKILWFFIEYH